MATTTNYGWTTPDDTALVKDGAAAIRTLGTSVDTTTKNLNPSTTLGDIEYRSSTANTNTRLGIGSTGNVLTVAGGVPTWAAPAGGGKVLQVVTANYSTGNTVTGTTFTDTGLTASITPSSATSKILVLVSQPIQSGQGGGSPAYQYRGSGRLLRGATVIRTMTNIIGITGDTASGLWEGYGNLAMNYLDSPATTSATTYKTQVAGENAGTFVNTSQGSGMATITLLEIGA
jgi:hypothetical protein